MKQPYCPTAIMACEFLINIDDGYGYLSVKLGLASCPKMGVQKCVSIGQNKTSETSGICLKSGRRESRESDNRLARDSPTMPHSCNVGFY